MKIVYIAHPIGGDQKRNVEKVLQIIRDINLSNSEVVPFVPYIPDCICLTDAIPEHRSRGIKNNMAIFNSGIIDELWLYGDKISNGMVQECKMAQELKIPIVAMTQGTANFGA